MEDLLGFAAVPAVVVLCMLVSQGVKLYVKFIQNEAIPFVSAVCGLILCEVAFLTIPGFIPADNWIVAAAIGIASGFAATGVHQAYKQNK